MTKSIIKVAIKRFACFCLLLMSVLPSAAQSHAPKNGDVIIFYPVADNVRMDVKGYDCFYSTDDAYKNGKFKIKPQNRFKAGSDGLTPLSEIEGHKFTVLSSVKENADAKKVDKKAYVCFLTREDGAQLFLRIPYVRQEKDNALTKAMTLYFTNALNEPLYKINIPCVSERDYNADVQELSGNQLITYKRSSQNLSKSEDIFKKQLDFMGGYVPKGLFYSGNRILCDSVGFCEVSTYSFKQPMAYCKDGDRYVKLPLYDLKGAGNAAYGESYRLTDFVESKDDVFNHLLTLADYKSNIYSLIGKRVRYDGTNYFTKLSDNEESNVINLQEHKEYKLKPETFYRIERFDIGIHSLDIVSIMSDSTGVHFEIPFRYIDPYIADKDVRDRKFELEDDYLARTARQREERENSAKAYDADYKRYFAKYKDKDIASSLAQGYYTEERLLRVRKKYGINKAKLILAHQYRLGWSVEEVRESIGYDFFERINSYYSKYVLYEMYQYRKSHPQYFLFEDGRLVSVSD